MQVYVLVFHSVWDNGNDPGHQNEYGEPEDTTIEGVFATWQAADNAKSSIGDLDPAHAFYTIEEHELSGEAAHVRAR